MKLWNCLFFFIILVVAICVELLNKKKNYRQKKISYVWKVGKERIGRISIRRLSLLVKWLNQLKKTWETLLRWQISSFFFSLVFLSLILHLLYVHHTANTRINKMEIPLILKSLVVVVTIRWAWATTINFFSIFFFCAFLKNSILCNFSTFSSYFFALGKIIEIFFWNSSI